MMNKKIAVFIDCENVSSKYSEQVFSKLNKIGDILICFAYKDWSSNQSKGWNQIVDENLCITTKDVKSYKDKPSTVDQEIFFDVAETMAKKDFINTIVLVSSDSDFTSLVRKIKFNGLDAIGFGELKTPGCLKKVYSEFNELSNENKESLNLLDIIKNVINSNIKENGYALVSEVGSKIVKLNKLYSSKAFGYKTFGSYFKKHKHLFETSYSGSQNSVMLVKVK